MPKDTRGGRRGGSNGATQERDPMNVPYDEWGEEIRFQDVLDEDGNLVGTITDEIRYNQVPDIRPTTKREVLADIDAWRQDNGTYGDEDTKIYIAYDDGTVIDADDLAYTTKSGEVRGKAYKKRGIVGASISTGDYEMVWGGEVDTRQGHRGEIRPWETWVAPDSGETGHTNSYSGYKATGAYRVRVKTTYNNPNGRGGYKTKHEIIRKSTVKPIND